MLPERIMLPSLLLAAAVVLAMVSFVAGEERRVYVDATASVDVAHCFPLEGADANELSRHCPEVWAVLEDGSGRKLRVRFRDPEDERWGNEHGGLQVRGVPIHGWLDASGELHDVGPARCFSHGGTEEEAASSPTNDHSPGWRLEGTLEEGVDVSAGGEANAAITGRLCRVGSDPPRWFSEGEAGAELEGLHVYRAAVRVAEEARVVAAALSVGGRHGLGPAATGEEGDGRADGIAEARSDLGRSKTRRLTNAYVGEKSDKGERGRGWGGGSSKRSLQEQGGEWWEEGGRELHVERKGARGRKARTVADGWVEESGRELDRG